MRHMKNTTESLYGRSSGTPTFLPLFERGSERGCTVYFGDFIERWSRRFQEHRFSPEIRAFSNQDSRVVITDRMLKFHTNDRRAHYRDRWLHALSSRAAEQQS